MDRRKFIGGIAVNLLAAPLAVLAQQPRAPSAGTAAIRKAGSALAPNTARNIGPYASSEPGGSNITDFSGITYDPIGKRMCLFGGGHGPSQETDIRILDLATLQWSSLYPTTKRSEMTLANGDSNYGRWISTNQPYARHSYNMSVVAGRRFYLFTAFGQPDSVGPSAPPYGGRVCWYDFDAKTWSYSSFSGDQTPWAYYSAAVLDPLSGKVLIAGLTSRIGPGNIWFYDPSSDTFVTGPSFPAAVGYAHDIVYFPPDDAFYVFQSDGRVWRIVVNRENPAFSTVTTLVVSGTRPPASSRCGFAYDSVNKNIGGNASNGTFYFFDPATLAWNARQMQIEPGSVGVPDQVFHCLGFDPDSGCFVMLGDVASNSTWLYRPPAGGRTANYQGIWWNAPGGSESGWGINFAHQGDVVFATWFTYDAAGRAWWIAMVANKVGENVYSGDLLATRGPRFDSVPFDPGQVTRFPVGVGTLAFDNADTGTFAYVVNGVSGNKTITREVFAQPTPACRYNAGEIPPPTTNYQDLWWADPPGSESGWGMNLAHQGSTIFATWFTYDVDGSPTWLSFTAAPVVEGVYGGTLLRTIGPPFSSSPFNPDLVTREAVGEAILTFYNPNLALFEFTCLGISRSKRITRQVFQTTGTTCQ